MEDFHDLGLRETRCKTLPHWHAGPAQLFLEFRQELR
jgi:hypothetical protein